MDHQPYLASPFFIVLHLFEVCSRFELDRVTLGGADKVFTFGPITIDTGVGVGVRVMWVGKGNERQFWRVRRNQSLR